MPNEEPKTHEKILKAHNRGPAISSLSCLCRRNTSVRTSVLEWMVYTKCFGVTFVVASSAFKKGTDADL